MNVTSPLGQPPQSMLPETSNPQQITERKQASEAIKTLSAAGAIPFSHDLSWSIDPTTKASVIKVIDASTHQVVNQFPAEYLLRLAAALQSEMSSENVARKLLG